MVAKKINSKDDPENIPEQERDYFLERQYPKYGNLVPRDVASRRAREIWEKGFGIGFGFGWSPCIGPILGSVLAPIPN